MSNYSCKFDFVFEDTSSTMRSISIGWRGCTSTAEEPWQDHVPDQMLPLPLDASLRGTCITGPALHERDC